MISLNTLISFELFSISIMDLAGFSIIYVSVSTLDFIWDNEAEI
jgi:hypothetical protein